MVVRTAYKILSESLGVEGEIDSVPQGSRGIAAKSLYGSEDQPFIFRDEREKDAQEYILAEMPFTPDGQNAIFVTTGHPPKRNFKISELVHLVLVQ